MREEECGIGGGGVADEDHAAEGVVAVDEGEDEAGSIFSDVLKGGGGGASLFPEGPEGAAGRGGRRWRRSPGSADH